VTNSTDRSDLTWMLDHFLKVPGVVHALVLSTDGLTIQSSSSLPRDRAELLAAGASTLYSVAGGMGRHFNSGPVQQAIVEYGSQTMLIAAAGPNACLAVLCDQAVDMGTVAFEMSRLVKRVGDYLGTETRPAPPRPTSHIGTGHG
jgi:predicted regulator of Ras-like GTPase activity (Roadblock/LC7/MglB family)